MEQVNFKDAICSCKNKDGGAEKRALSQKVTQPLDIRDEPLICSVPF